MARWMHLVRTATAALLMAAVLALAPGSARAEKAADFTLRDIDGNSVTLSELRGKVVILSFWATWCGPCKEEMPHLQKMYDAKKEKGFTALSVSTDDARSASRVKPSNDAQPRSHRPAAAAIPGSPPAHDVRPSR